jgi:hypothetical protein
LNVADDDTSSVDVIITGALGAVTSPSTPQTVTFTDGRATLAVVSQLAQAITATLGSSGTLNTSASRTIFVVPALPAKVQIAAIPDGTVDWPQNASLRILDAFDNFVPSGVASVTVVFSDATTTATLQSRTVSIVNGQVLLLFQLLLHPPPVLQLQLQRKEDKEKRKGGKRWGGLFILMGCFLLTFFFLSFLFGFLLRRPLKVCP